MFDKFHDECGVFAIYGNPEAAKLSPRRFSPQPPRGREGGGPPPTNGRNTHCIKPRGPGPDISPPGVRAGPPGARPTAPPRYSPAGDTVLLNAQPFSVAC